MPSMFHVRLLLCLYKQHICCDDLQLSPTHVHLQPSGLCCKRNPHDYTGTHMGVRALFDCVPYTTDPRTATSFESCNTWFPVWLDASALVKSLCASDASRGMRTLAQSGQNRCLDVIHMLEAFCARDRLGLTANIAHRQHKHAHVANCRNLTTTYQGSAMHHCKRIKHHVEKKNVKKKI